MKTIIITMPDSVNREAERITEILDSGMAEYIHLRKPSWDAIAMEMLIQTVPARLHPRLKLHSCFELLGEYELAGIHLNHRCPTVPAQIVDVRPDLKISCSCHTIEEVRAADKQGNMEYITLSPVFTSISKPDYHANALLYKSEITEVLRRLKTPVIALGGVTPHKYTHLESLGYAGGAMLGYVWNNK